MARIWISDRERDWRLRLRWRRLSAPTGRTPGGLTVRDNIAFINMLGNDIDIVNVSAGTHGNPLTTVKTFPTYLSPRDVNASLAAEIKKGVNVAVAAVGAISEPEMAEELIASGAADFVSMAKALIADPDFPRKAKAGKRKDIVPCIGCHQYLEAMHEKGILDCSVNPRSGREVRAGIPAKAENPKKVCVIGGGPAGMTAAITASDCGHSVTLIEKDTKLGGLLKIADFDPVKERLRTYKDYLIRQVEKREINVLTGTKAVPELVRGLEPDALIVAAGSDHIIPNIPGVNNNNVLTAVQAHLKPERIGARTVVIGGNLVGCETALFIGAHLGKAVTVVKMTEQAAADANMPVKTALEHKLGQCAAVLTGLRCEKIMDSGVILTKQDGTQMALEADTVVLAVGMRANTMTSENLWDVVPEFTEVGDCVTPATVLQGTHTAYFSAMSI